MTEVGGLKLQVLNAKVTALLNLNRQDRVHESFLLKRIRFLAH